jgi:hypothetical protein
MKKTKLKKNNKKIVPKTKAILFLACLVVIALGVSVFTAVSRGTGPLASIFAPAGINAIGAKSATSTGSSLGKSGAARGNSTTTKTETKTTNDTKTNNTKTESKTTNNIGATVTGATGGIKGGKDNDGNSMITKTQKNPDGTSTTITETTTNGVKTTTTTLKDNKGNVVLTTNIGSQTSETGEKNTIVTMSNKKTGENTIVKSGAEGEKAQVTQFKVAPDPVFSNVPASPVTTDSRKVNCDAGTCGTNGSPVCDGAYVFTGGNSSSSSKQDGTYGCVQCKGGSLSRDVKSCDALIAAGEPVVLPYDMNNEWLSSVKTDGMTAPCFINRGGTWVQAAYGQAGEGESAGKVCDGNGAWVAGSLGTARATAGAALPPASPKKTACNGGSVAGLVITGARIAGKLANPATIPSGTAELVFGTINGVQTAIDCSNKDNPVFNFCRSTKGLDENGNCIPDVVDPTIATSTEPIPEGTFGAPQAPPIATAVQVGAGGLAGCGAGGAAGTLVMPIVGTAIGCAVGAVTGGYIANSVGNVAYDATHNVDQAPPIATAVQVGAGGLAGCAAGGALGTVFMPVVGTAIGCAVGAVTGGYIANSVGNVLWNLNNPNWAGPDENNEESSLTSPSTLAQGGGSGLNTGPINEINSPVNTAGQPAANVSQGNNFRHYYQGDYGNGIKENGCYLTAATMLISTYGTVDKGLTPEQLNEKYLQNAYVGGGDISILSNANKVNGIEIKDVSRDPAVISNPSGYVANNSSTNNPMAVAIYCDTCYQGGHWVIAVGKDASGNPLVWDPLKPNQSAPVALSANNYPGLNLDNNGESVDVRTVTVTN